MRNPQIFIFTEVSVAGKYGIGTYIKQIIQNISKYYNITLVSLFSNIEHIVEEKYLGINHILIPHDQNSYSEKEELRYYKRIIFILKNNYVKNNIVYFHLNNPNKSLFSLLKESFKSSKIIYTLHYIGWKAYIKHDINHIDEILYNDELSDVIYRDQQCLSYCDVIITLSESSYEILKTVYQIDVHKIFCIPNAVEDIFNEKLSLQKTELKVKYGFSQDDEIILFVGRIVPNKGILELIEAFKKLLLEKPKLKLFLVGDGCFDLCIKHITPFFSKICFSGFIEREKIIEFYHMADIGVLPSHFEECSCVALEMMAAKLPLVTTNVHGLIELKNNKDICSFELGDQKELELIISKLLSDKIYSKKCSCERREIYEEKYGLNIFIQNMLNVYNSII